MRDVGVARRASHRRARGRERPLEVAELVADLTEQIPFRRAGAVPGLGQLRRQRGHRPRPAGGEQRDGPDLASPFGVAGGELTRHLDQPGGDRRGVGGSTGGDA